MNNHLPQIPAGAQRIESFEVYYQDGNKDCIALYQNWHTGDITVLVDIFRGGSWDSVLLLPATADQLRQALNKAHRQRRS